jgi:ABC-type multidrug transport system fused ATPase/permease subunit
LGGHSLRDYHQEDVRRLISVVSQRTHLFNATVRENLRLARPDAAEGDLIRAAQRAGIHTVIRSLPQGYDTWVGEQGVRLSAGQRQRLAIARALLKFPVSGGKDTPILILDEATANLDPISARKVMAAINSLLGDRTILIATHRLVGLESVDEILVLRSGRIVERGRHGDLLQMGGLYRRMWDSQRAVLADDRPPA